MKHIARWVAMTAAALLPAVSHASVITQSYTFSFTDFEIVGAPYDPWTGSFTVTYDPSVFGIKGSLDAFGSNLPASYGTFVWLNQPGLGLVIGDDCNTVSCIAGSNQAFISVPQNIGLYTVVNTDYLSETGTITAVPGPMAGAGLPSVVMAVSRNAYRRD
jgi:hypothetical protein